MSRYYIPTGAREIAEKIEISLSLLQEYIAADQPQHQQQPLSRKLGDRLTALLKKLSGEINVLSGEFLIYTDALKNTKEGAFSFSHSSGIPMAGKTRMNFVLSWFEMIDCIIADIDFAAAKNLDSITKTLSSTIPPLLNPPPSTKGAKQSRTTPQKRLFAAYERTLKSDEYLCMNRDMLKHELTDSVINAIPSACNEARKDFSWELDMSTRNFPEKSFNVAQQSVRKLMKLFGKMLTPGSEERANMGCYSPKINILLRVIENYFYPPLAMCGDGERFQRSDIRGNPELGNVRKGFPMSKLDMFHIGEIGGVLVYLLAASAAFKVGALQGESMGVTEDVMGRMKMLVKRFEMMWQMVLTHVQKVQWLASGKRKLRPIIREENVQSKVLGNAREMPNEAPTRGGLKRHVEDPGTGRAPVVKEAPMEGYSINTPGREKVAIEVETHGEAAAQKKKIREKGGEESGTGKLREGRKKHLVQKSVGGNYQAFLCLNGNDHNGILER